MVVSTSIRCELMHLVVVHIALVDVVYGIFTHEFTMLFIATVGVKGLVIRIAIILLLLRKMSSRLTDYL